MKLNTVKAVIALAAMCFSLILPPTQLAYANGAPKYPDLVSPSNGAMASSNPPTLCAKNNGDPDGDQVYFKFEINGGSEPDHISDWIFAGSPGDTICWTDTSPWSAQSHAWQVRAKDSQGNQAGATPQWGINIPPASTPTCNITNVSVNPPAPQTVGTEVIVFANASQGVQSLRFIADSNEIGTVSGSSGSVTWHTSGYGPGNHVIIVNCAVSGAGYVGNASHPYDLISPSSGGGGSSSGGGASSGNNGAPGSSSSGGGGASSSSSSGVGGVPSGYTFCISENQRCNFTGMKDVAYGAEGKFYFKYGVTGGIDCNNSTFGDPAYGVVKACYTRDSSGGSSGGSTSGSGGSGGTSGGGSSAGTTSGGASGSAITGTTYTVVRGDSLWKIAQRAGTTVATLIELNKGTHPSLATNPSYIQVGWVLTLPGSSSTAANILSQTDLESQPVAGSSAQLTLEARQEAERIWACVKQDIELLPAAFKQSPSWYQELQTFLDAAGFNFRLVQPPVPPLAKAARLIAKLGTYHIPWAIGIVQDCWSN